MDLFFGAHNRPQQTVEIRVEERARDGRRAAGGAERRRVAEDRKRRRVVDDTRRRRQQPLEPQRVPKEQQPRRLVAELPADMNIKKTPTPERATLKQKVPTARLRVKKKRSPKPREISPQPREITPEPREITPEPREIMPEPKEITPEPSLEEDLPEGDPPDPDQPADVVSSVEVVQESTAQYDEFFVWEAGEQRVDTVMVRLPAGAGEEFSLRSARGSDEYQPLADLMATVRTARDLAGAADGGVERQLERARNRQRGADFVRAVQAFNELVLAHRADRPDAAARARAALHVTQQAYSRVVGPAVARLRRYRAFSNNVYGEILAPLISEIANRTGIDQATTFVDLGCGVGNVVLQLAAQTMCRASGIEIMREPAQLAQHQAREFTRRMRHYGLSHGPVRIWQGDFCDNPNVQRVLPQADVVLVNNYAFDSALNQRLLQLFLDLRDGAQIVSLRPFVAPDHQITARSVYSPESILSVRRYPYASRCVSWTDTAGEYFVHTVDRSRVRAFLERMIA
ncbi:Nucleosomal histone H3-Lys79 methylase [Coemansia sp. RSA 552]|nr:Nucleosomal histone H3-Lys79 methylase [Coemansia sp. RSA 552]